MLPRPDEITSDVRNGSAEFEVALAACIERYAEHGPSAIDEACARHPEFDARLRERMDSLSRLGMLVANDELPRRFGRYELLRKLGEGGMGVVYLARDSRDGREVALKVGLFALGPDDRVRARFEREIKAFGQLAHPCIVPVVDVGEVSGRPYFAMEYVEGATLARIIEELQRSRLPFEALAGEHVRRIAGADGDEAAWSQTYVETVCRIVLDLAGALAHAHEQSIVHRDVKPSNVLVRRDGRALVFDLGLAHLADQPSLTRSGDFTGTPYYVSPEQIAARPTGIDRRTDVYSLGVTLYELLALRRPFEGPTTARVLRRIQVSEPPSLRRLNPAVPRDLATICATAMEKNPARRYQNMDELADDLRAFLAFKPVRAKPISAWLRGWRRVRAHPTLSAACALAAIVAIGLPVGLLWANAAIRVQRDRAELSAREAQRQAELSSAQNEFLVGLFQRAGESAGKAHELLDRGVAQLEEQPGLDPLVRAALFETAGRIYVNLEQDEHALPLFDRAFAIRHRELGESHPDVARLLHALADVHLRVGNTGSALALASRSLAAFESAGAVNDVEAARCRRTLAEASIQVGELGIAHTQLHAALETLATLPDTDDDTALVCEQLGEIARRQGEHDVAAMSFARALALHRKRWSPDPRAIARTLDALAELDDLRGAHDEAERNRRESASLIGAADGAPGQDRTAAGLHVDFAPPSQAEYERSFQAGVTGLQSGELPAAIKAFERCLEIAPRQSSCAYNIACGNALAGDVEEGLRWLKTAIDYGFAFSDERVEIARKDADLAALRADPRCAAIFERIERERAAAHEFAAQPAIWLPDGAAPANGWPALVVLHERASTKEQIVAGPWREVAQRLGAALIAPSGSLPTASEPKLGMAWFESFGMFMRAPWLVEEPICHALRQFADAQALDRDRVLLVGEGTSAALAFDLAARAPGLFRAVLLDGGPPHTELASQALRTAASIGLRVSVRLDPSAPIVGAPSDCNPRAFADQVARWLERNNLAASPDCVVLAPANVEGSVVLARGLLEQRESAH